MDTLDTVNGFKRMQCAVIAVCCDDVCVDDMIGGYGGSAFKPQGSLGRKTNLAGDHPA